MQDTIFLNADYIVIEYVDIIKSPYVVLLSMIRNNIRIRELLDLTEIDNLQEAGLTEWYVNRRHQNFLIDLCKLKGIKESDLDNLLDAQMSCSNMWFEHANFLNIETVLRSQSKFKMAKEVIIYYPHSNMYAKEDMEKHFNMKFKFVKTFEEAVEIAGSNSTYFLSNIKNINKMFEMEKLKFSSITLPVEYRYNKKNMDDFDIEFKELFEKQPFKLTYMRACSENRS